MKAQKTTIEQFLNIYTHPSAILFRAVELRVIYESISDMHFRGPSLDLGCGDGRIAELIFDKSFTYGMDNGEANDVDDAIKNERYEKVLLESAEKMSLPNDSINFVFSNCVIEHIPDNDAVLSEVGRILRKNGDFVFTVPSHNFPDYLYLTNKLASWGLGFLSHFYKYRRNKMLNQFHCYNINDWRKKLSRHGLHVVKYKYYMTQEALMLWDLMALKVFINKIITPNYEKKIFSKYSDLINKIAKLDSAADGLGAGLFIHCIKQ